MIWHVVARDGVADGFIPDLSADEPRLFIAFDRHDDPARMRENVLENLHREYGRLPSPSVKDLLRLAMAVYAADLSIPRAFADDNWTRDMVIHLPVADPAQWNRKLPLKADHTKIEFSGIISPGGSDEEDTFYGNADHWDSQGSRCGNSG